MVVTVEDDVSVITSAAELAEIEEFVDLPDPKTRTMAGWKPQKAGQVESTKQRLRGILEAKGYELPNTQQQHARYLGNYPELVRHFATTPQHVKTMAMSTAAARNWLNAHPNVMAQMGLVPAGQVAPPGMHVFDNTWAINHIVARSLGGRHHPYNYFVMESAVNCHFNQWFTMAKVAYVGAGAVGKAKAFQKWMAVKPNGAVVDFTKFDPVD